MPWKQLDCIPRLKPGKILSPSKSVKYLHVHLDEHLNWKCHISSIATKLRRANGALSKLRYFVPTKILSNVYHAIFASHTRYASQIWGLRDNSVTHRILTLQNTAMRLLTFNGPRTSATPLYSELGILNLFDQVEVMNILYVHKYLNGNLPTDTLNTLKFQKIDHSFGTRGNVIGLIKQPTICTTNYGLYSFSNLSIKTNGIICRKPFRTFAFLISRFQNSKTLATKFYLSKYAEN